MKKLGLGALIALSLAFGAHAAGPNNGATGATALLVPLNGPIGPATSDYIDQAFRKAETIHARLFILELDTPGGLSTSMRHIIKAMLNAPLPVVVYVAPSGARAASAGTYITYAAQIAAMAPATNIGAATPVSLRGGGGGNKEKGKHASKPPSRPASSQEAERRKTVNDAVAYIRALAEKRGRNADWAEKAVRQGVSMSADEALKAHVVDLIAPSVKALLTRIDGRTVDVQGRKVTLRTQGIELRHFSPSWRIRLLSVLSNPTLAYFLLMAGIVGLVIEGLHPGGTFPGVLGAISLLLALFAFQLLPINYTGFAFLALGVVLMFAEALVPSFGVLGFGGVASFIFGSVMLMDTNVPGYSISMGAIIGIALCAVAALTGALYLFWRSRRQPIRTGDEAMVGARVEVLEDFSDRGWVIAHGEHWQARTHIPMQKGQYARVRAMDGLVLEVEPLPEGARGIEQNKHERGAG